MENITIENMYDLKETIAADLFTEAEYPLSLIHISEPTRP